MADEEVVEGGSGAVVVEPEVVVGDVGEKPPEIKERERLAKNIGWTDENTFYANPRNAGRDWVDAETFILRAPTPDVVKKLRGQIDELTNTVHDIREHQDKLTKAEIGKLKAELAEARREAIKDADIDRVEELDEQIRKVDEDVVQPRNEPKEHPAIVSWKEDNPWYGTDKRMTRIADAIAAEHEDLGTPVEKLLKIIDAEIADIKGVTKTVVSPVEGGTRRVTTQTGQKKYSYSDLNDVQKRACERFVKTGTMTREQYVADLAKMGEIG